MANDRSAVLKLDMSEWAERRSLFRREYAAAFPYGETFRDERTLAAGETWPYVLSGTGHVMRGIFLFVPDGKTVDANIVSTAGSITLAVNPMILLTMPLFALNTINNGTETVMVCRHVWVTDPDS